MEATKEKLVKPSSYKRPRLPSGTPPKPAPRPAKKDLKKEPQEEKGEEEKPGVKKEEKPEERKEEKPEVTKEEKPEEKKEEKPEEKKEGKQEDKKAVKPEKKEEEPDGKKEEQTLTEQKKEVAVEGKKKIAENVSVEEVKKKEETEAKETEPRAELKEPNENVKQKLEDVSAYSGVNKETENVDGKVENGETHNIEKKGDNQTAAAKDDLWVKRDSGKEALRPGGRSLSLKIQRSTSGTDKGPAASVRSATLPKPWSPGQAPSSMLSRKLSWEMPKSGSEDAVRGAKKDRSGSTSEVPIPEDSEEQSP